MSKTFNRVDEYAQAIKRIHAHGIAVQVGIIFGFDHGTEAVFEETLDFLEDSPLFAMKKLLKNSRR